MSRIIIHAQAEAFIGALAPEPRARLVRAMKKLSAGDVKSLEGRLAGYWRLREGGYRIIFADSLKEGVRTFDCLFAERRSFVYELFEQILAEQLLTQ
jgi:mRNA-degrading endonuclease RelE of RelBE toxin-antitoxin system